MTKRLMVPLLAVLLAAAPADAQRSTSILKATTGAVLGGAVGFLAGGVAGGAVTSSDCRNSGGNECLASTFPGFFWGAGAGTTLGVPIGAHIAVRRDGALGPSLIASGVIYAAEVLALRSIVRNNRTDHETAAIAIVSIAPVLQIISSVYFETRRPD